MNEETWKKIRALEAEIGKFKQHISVANSEQVAAATMQDRWGIDHNPCLVQMLWDGGVLGFFYYHSDEWISQPIDLPSMGITSYTGPVENAPTIYGPGTYIIDSGITNFHRKTIGGYLSSQTSTPNWSIQRSSKNQRLS